MHKNVLTRRYYYPTQVRAALPHRYSFHALRHFAASVFISQKVDLKRLSGWLGHSTVTLTMDRYGHLLADEMGGQHGIADHLDNLGGWVALE